MDQREKLAWIKAGEQALAAIYRPPPTSGVRLRAALLFVDDPVTPDADELSDSLPVRRPVSQEGDECRETNPRDGERVAPFYRTDVATFEPRSPTAAKTGSAVKSAPAAKQVLAEHGGRVSVPRHRKNKPQPAVVAGSVQPQSKTCNTADYKELSSRCHACVVGTLSFSTVSQSWLTFLPVQTGGRPMPFQGRAIIRQARERKAWGGSNLDFLCTIFRGIYIRAIMVYSTHFHAHSAH